MAMWVNCFANSYNNVKLNCWQMPVKASVEINNVTTIYSPLHAEDEEVCSEYKWDRRSQGL